MKYKVNFKCIVCVRRVQLSISFLAFIMCLLSPRVLAIHNYGLGQPLNVLAPSGMNLRDAPRGNVLQLIPYGAQIKTLQAKSYMHSERVEGIKGNWVKVNYQGKTGFLFDGFLSSLPAPELNGGNFHEYTLKNLRPVSDLLEINNVPYHIGASIIATQLFEIGSDTVIYHLDGYCEGAMEILSIPNISLEEAYLVARAMYNEAYVTSLKEVMTGNYDVVDQVAGFEARSQSEFDGGLQLEALKGFVLNGISETGNIYDNAENIGTVNDFYFCSLLFVSCHFDITIRKHNNRVFLIGNGGC